MMKKNLLLAGVLALMSITAKAQSIAAENVPATVTETFKNKFAKAKGTKWELDYDNYEASFKLGKKEQTAVFGKDGHWLRTETPVRTKELPKNIKTELTKEFGELSGYKIKSAERVDSEKGIYYILEVAKGEKQYNMQFNEKGELMEKEEKTSVEG
jgi:hypothetical protein